MSWYRAPLWDFRPDIASCRNVAVWNLRSCFCGAPSLTRGRVCNLQCNHSIVRVAQNPKPYFTVSSETPPNLEGQVPVFIFPRNRVAQLYLRALGSLYVVSYDSQGYIYIHKLSQEECARLRDGGPYGKAYRYNPKHLCPKMNGYGDIGQRKVWSFGIYIYTPRTWRELVLSSIT
jgi:hypothetical protein